MNEKINKFIVQLKDAQDQKPCFFIVFFFIPYVIFLYLNCFI